MSGAVPPTGVVQPALAGAGPAGAGSGLGGGAERTVVRVSPWSIVRGILLLAAIGLLLSMVQLASTTLWWIAIAATVAGLVLPLVNRLDRVMPRWLAIVAVLLGLTVVGGGLVGLGLVEVNKQISDVRQNWVDGSREIEASEGVGKVATEFGLSNKVESLFSSLPVYLGGGDATETVQAVASSAGSLVVIGFFVLLLVISGRRFYRAALAQLDDVGARRRIAELASGAYRTTTGYLGWMIARAAVYGLLAGVVARLFGNETPTVIGLWFATWSLVPGLGLVLGALPLAIGVSVFSLPLGVSLLVVATAVQVVDGRFVLRRIERGTVAVGPALTLLAGVFGVILYGTGGVMVLLFATTMTLALLQRLQPLGPDLSTALRAVRHGPAGVPDHPGG